MVDTMKIAVVGLGVEGKNAVKSLLDYGFDVYASDMDENIEVDSSFDNIDLDLGHHDLDKIYSADAVVLSPALWNTELGRRLRKKNKILSDVLEGYKSIFTVGVTGTNGKTTTCLMIKDILEMAGLNVLVGGNAGGGFDGYTKLILEASKNNFNILIVEVCDMTLDFCDYTFDFDIVVVTNIGRDHLNVHHSLKNYQKSLCRFLESKTAILNKNDVFLSEIAYCADKAILFGETNKKLKVFGRFNLLNAAAAEEVAKALNIPDKYIKESLENFEDVRGRSTMMKLFGSNIIIGKTDNADAAAAVFGERKFDVIIIGTPRKNELYRFDILKEVIKANPDIVGLFPGLDETTDLASNILKSGSYKGEIRLLKDVSDVTDFVIKCSRVYKNIVIGGNGQTKILEIQNILKHKKIYGS